MFLYCLEFICNWSFWVRKKINFLQWGNTGISTTLLVVGQQKMGFMVFLCVLLVLFCYFYIFFLSYNFLFTCLFWFSFDFLSFLFLFSLKEKKDLRMGALGRWEESRISWGSRNTIKSFYMKKCYIQTLKEVL